MECCRNCSSYNLESDIQSGDIVCIECGFVNDREMDCGFRLTSEGSLPHIHSSSKNKILGSTFDPYERNNILKGGKKGAFAKISWNHLAKLNKLSSNSYTTLKEDVGEIIENDIIASFETKRLGVKILNETHSLESYNKKLKDEKILSFMKKESVQLPLNSRHAQASKNHSPTLNYSRKMIAISVCNVAAKLLDDYFNLDMNLNGLEVKRKHVIKEMKLIKSYLISMWKIEENVGKILIQIRPKQHSKLSKRNEKEELAIIDDLRESTKDFDANLSKKLILLSMKLFEILDSIEILENCKLRNIVASVIAVYLKNNNQKISRKKIGIWLNIKGSKVHNMINNYNFEVCYLVEKLNSIDD